MVCHHSKFWRRPRRGDSLAFKGQTQLEKDFCPVMVMSGEKLRAGKASGSWNKRPPGGSPYGPRGEPNEPKPPGVALRSRFELLRSYSVAGARALEYFIDSLLFR